MRPGPRNALRAYQVRLFIAVPRACVSLFPSGLRTKSRCPLHSVRGIGCPDGKLSGDTAMTCADYRNDFVTDSATYQCEYSTDAKSKAGPNTQNDNIQWR